MKMESARRRKNTVTDDSSRRESLRETDNSAILLSANHLITPLYRLFTSHLISGHGHQMENN
eukprot:scaffold6042_cov247-Ochromonas_danica.AAC.17